jgi:hypothetical protein
MACRLCSLVICHSAFQARIPLRDFHLKRGDLDNQRPLADLTMASNLVECLGRDEWPSQGTILDFGIETDRHLGALQYAVLGGVTAYDLDCVMGHGPAITQLTRAVTIQPYRDVEFSTAYDPMYADSDDEPWGWDPDDESQI